MEHMLVGRGSTGNHHEIGLSYDTTSELRTKVASGCLVCGRLIIRGHGRWWERDVSQGATVDLAPANAR